MKERNDREAVEKPDFCWLRFLASFRRIFFEHNYRQTCAVRMVGSELSCLCPVHGLHFLPKPPTSGYIIAFKSCLFLFASNVYKQRREEKSF